MIDLHTHVLPDWDDGASDQVEANRMVEIAREDGITTIVLTPHIFRMTKHGADANNLKSRIRTFLEKPKPGGVNFFTGAEVYFHPNMISFIKDNDLSVNNSNYVFIEFPSQHIPGGATNLIFQMMLEGFIPIISHPERNAVLARFPGILDDLVRQGALGQLTAQSITGEFGKSTRRAAVCFLRQGLIHLIASDAHNATTRPPRLSKAVREAKRYVGANQAESMVTTVPEAILNNEPIPRSGKRLDIFKKTKLRFFF